MCNQRAADLTRGASNEHVRSNGSGESRLGSYVRDVWGGHDRRWYWCRVFDCVRLHLLCSRRLGRKCPSSFSYIHTDLSLNNKTRTPTADISSVPRRVFHAHGGDAIIRRKGRAIWDATKRLAQFVRDLAHALARDTSPGPCASWLARACAGSVRLKSKSVYEDRHILLASTQHTAPRDAFST